MKRIYSLLILLVLFATVQFAQVHISTAYNYNPLDTIMIGFKSIRGVDYHPDPFGTGKSAILATNYQQNGVVHLFVTVGNDSIQLVWTSPILTTGGGGSTPRYCKFGDLDNDGLIEIIYQSNNRGVLIFEWDGVAGSYNFGTIPSQEVSAPIFSAVSGNAEYFEIVDVDGDNENELLIAYNSAPNENDRYYIVSAVGDWSTDNPGFSSFNVEAVWIRTEMGSWAGGGSPYALISAQLDGSGPKEIILHNWNNKNVIPIRTLGANSYAISDTTTGKQNYMLGGTLDYVALFGGMAFDVDGDGRDEVYLPTYVGAISGPGNGKVHMIHYEAGQPLDRIDSTNVFELDFSGILTSDIFGYGYGDLDGNGKPNLYFSSSYPRNVLSAEFQGSNKTDPANWVMSILYAGENDIYTAMTIRDSAGTIDTLFTRNTAFASKIYSRYTDFDKDNKHDIILPYQALNDSITVRNLVWNSGTSQFDTTSVTTILNPKRWSLRILESTVPSGIEVKELTIITPDDYVLEQNYPNPFNPTTTIRFSLPVKSYISLKVYDMLGKEVATLINNQEMNNGSFEVEWDGTNNFGNKVASGNYVAELRYGNFSKSVKMTLLK